MRKNILLTAISIFYALCLPLSISAASSLTCNSTTPGDCPAGLTQIEQVFASVVSVSVGLAFIAMLVMVVTAGIKYLTSGGEQKAVQSAHQTMTWAFLGILFMAVAWVLLQLLAAFTGIEALKLFDIKSLCSFGGTDWCKP